MPRTFLEKLQPQLVNKWLILPGKDKVTYIYATSHVYYQKRGTWGDEGMVPYTGRDGSKAYSAYIGYWIDDEQGKPFTYDVLNEFYDPFSKEDQDKKRKLDLSTLLGCYKLTDPNKKEKLDRLLAKRLLHGRN